MTEFEEQIVERARALRHIVGDGAAGRVRIAEAMNGTLTLLAIVYGKGSSQERQLLEIERGSRDYAAGAYQRAMFASIGGALNALIGDVETGLVVDAVRRGAGSVLTDFVGLAREKLSDGQIPVAAVLAAAAYEDTIRKLGELLANVHGRPDLQDVVSALKQAGVLTGPSVSTAVGYLRFRNDALHADWAKIDHAVTGSCLAFVEGLILKHFG